MFPLTFQHRAGVSPYTSSFDLAETCVFAKQSLGPILCGLLSQAPLLPKLRGQFAEFLNNASPARLRILSSPTCVGLRYGHLTKVLSFSCQCGIICFATYFSLPFAALYQPCGQTILLRPLIPYRLRWLRNLNRMCIDYASRPRLSSRLTLSGRTFLKKP